MRYFAFLLLAFVLEVFVLSAVGSWIGVWKTLGLMLVTGVLGGVLVKRGGIRVWSLVRQSLSEGQLPSDGILSGFLILAAGVFLLLPGFLTDLFGLLLLVPRFRCMVAERLRAVMEKKARQGVMQVVALDPQGWEQAPEQHGWMPGAAEFFSKSGHGEVVDTEGVEIQEGLLLGPGSSDDSIREDEEP
ncbi:MAG TPA: FxsA family protein [Polyangiaceae bacterium]|nr:MAG: phage T7 F exclusion suppressor FxsA [Deltaproteobacteria bacterium ADurb.Bin207]HNS99134.1 FxsA family protein [Polyangiaceae bacterium]HNZ24354.1 FxsA family protein [Polyangiaceae bacterium]HOD22624.1 FxsA family protein [Polyangiaceae bacterium]HOE50432.1 FxsA family protein [Polyangiaceae bacterium]